MLSINSFIEIQNLFKNYTLEGPVSFGLVDVTLKIRSGETLALVGPSGSGKSTLLNLIGGLDLPTSGDIIINNKNITQYNSDQRADFRNQTIGFVFQNFNLIPVLTAFENVTLPAQLSGNMSDYIKEKAKKILCDVGLGEQLNQRVNQLSGGQMQRVAIARALINSPQVVLADEPTANLDVKTKHEIIKLLIEQCQINKSTCIIATHDQDLLKYTDRIISMNDGKIVEDKKLYKILETYEPVA